MNNLMAFLQRKAMDAVLAAFAVIIVLHVIFGGVFDFVTNVIILLLMFAASRINKIAAWWNSKT